MKKMSLDEIKAKFRKVEEYDRDNRMDSADDLRFFCGEQWDGVDERIRHRQGRPTLVLNMLDPIVRRIVGQARQMSPSVRVFSADYETPAVMAQLFEGLIRDIEQRTNAKAARMNAHTDQVICGIGHYEVYYEMHPQKEEMVIGVRTIKDPLSVIWDPSSKEIDRSDANYCFRIVDVPKVEFEEEYEGKEAIDFNFSDSSYSFRYTDNLRPTGRNHVRLCQYWQKYKRKHYFIVTKDGMTVDVTNIKTDKDKTDEEKSAEILQYAPVRDFSRKIQHLRFQLLSGKDILEVIEDYPCRHIPIVPVIGEEIFLGDAIYRKGLIRPTREHQKLYNYMMSIGMEQMGQAVKAPWLVTEAMIKVNESMWKQANVSTTPFLVYEPDLEAPTSKPERIFPEAQHRDTVQMAQLFANEMNNATGVHEEALGKETNAKSGKAIQARQAEAMMTSNIFGHNLQSSVRHEGRILLSMIKHLYTENKFRRIITHDQKEEFVEFNQKVYDYYRDQTLIFNDLSAGEFEVRANSGMPHASVKQEAVASIMEMIQLNPQMMPFLIGNLVDIMEVPNQESLKESVKMYQDSVMGQQQPQQGQQQPNMAQLAKLLN